MVGLVTERKIKGSLETQGDTPLNSLCPKGTRGKNNKSQEREKIGEGFSENVALNKLAR